MSSLKWFIKWIWEHIQDTWKDIQKFPEDIKDSIRNSILRQPQTLRDYNITSVLTQKELLDTLNGFHDSYIWDIKNWIAKRLLATMDKKNFPLNVEKIENLYDLFMHIDKSDFSDEEMKKLRKEILEHLTPQDIFSLQIYNYNSNFWNTHIKDGNNLKDLLLFKPHIPRPDKPKNEPQKPNKSDFQYIKDYEKATKNWEKEMKQRKSTPEYKKRNERTEKTERMKDILKVIVDLWPLNRLSNGIIKRISAILERWWWAWVQHTIEAVFRPNILEMSPEEEELLRHILIDVKYGKKCFIVLNHETFANIPMTIVKFMQVAHEMWIENANEYFTTIIWPLLATHRWQNALLNSLSSILVTHPADNRILWAKRITSHQQNNALSQLEKDLTKENSRWQVYFCATSWTRDIVHYWDNWIPQIFIPDASRWSNITTWKLIRTLYSKNPDLKVYAVSTNTTDLKKPNPEQWVSPNNNKWNKNATVSMHLKEINTEDLSTENIISTILSGINYPIPSWETRKLSKNPIKNRLNKWKQYYDYNENGKINEVPCATLLPTIIFQYLKKFTKTPEYTKTWKLPKEFFDEDNKLNLDNEVFTYLQKYAKTNEYLKNRKIHPRFFDKNWFINLNLLKAEIEENQEKQ